MRDNTVQAIKLNMKKRQLKMLWVEFFVFNSDFARCSVTTHLPKGDLDTMIETKWAITK